jgi:hypothetical protein
MLERLLAEVWRRCPRTVPPGALRASRWAAAIAVPATILVVVSPLLLHPWALGEHNWDQMNTQREVVVKTLLRFHQFPFWDPYECGGHSAWGSLESDPIVVSPWLPVYLLSPLAIAIRVEVVVATLGFAVGCWLLASRFTESRALRALLPILVVANSRFGLQMAAGHPWHLFYGLLPWILILFDRAIDPASPPARSRRDVALAGVLLAGMVYGDAIYPVPHVAFAVTVYAAVMAHARRSLVPLRALAAFAAVGIGLASPKLLPLYEEMQRFPRWITSEEAIWPQDLYRVLTWPVGDYTATSAFTNGMWHEWGLYLGRGGLALLVVGLVASRGPRERALKWVGFAMIAIVIGGFHQLTPWRLLHLLPIFKSQHVPSRWLFPAIIVLACAAVSGLERLLSRAGDRRPFLEMALGFAAAAIALDMSLIARRPITQSFINPTPYEQDVVTPFHIVDRLAPRGDYRPGLEDVSTLPGVLENVGTMECDTHNVLHITHRDEEGRMPGVGAWGDQDPDYRGEAYVAEAHGTAEIASWTPNAVEVRVKDARAGDRLVLNQNWDPGWNANGVPAVAYRDAVATTLDAPDETVRFRYRPRSLPWGLAVCAATLVSAGVWLRRRRGA